MMSKYQELAVCLCHIYTQFAITSDAAAQRVATRVGQVFETEPNPPVSAWASELIPTVIKKLKYPVLIHKHGLLKNQILSYYYITMILNFFQNPNNHLENYWNNLECSKQTPEKYIPQVMLSSNPGQLGALQQLNLCRSEIPK